jgi:antitoxin component YwqK of YwqJK toxin-antitoxin module
MNLPSILLALISTTIISSGEPTPKPVRVLTSDKIEERNGVFYEVNQEAPFTGVIRDFYPNGQKRTERNYKDGLKHGVQTEWHENGEKYRVVYFPR